METLNVDSDTTTAYNGNTTGNSSNTLQCNLCGEIVPNMLEFKTHKLVSFYQLCAICSKSDVFANCGAYIDHLEDVHKKTKVYWITNN